jgi:hypothetical protein
VIAADLAEAAAALDAPGTGNVVFATLVDDPASVREIVDAYLGELMFEAAIAGDSCDAGFVFIGAVNEIVTALDVPDAAIPAGPPTTWNPADLSGMTLSGGNLTAAGGNFTGVRATKGLSSGKYYFEITVTTTPSGYVGLARSTADLTSGGTTGAVGVTSAGGVEVNGITSTGISIGSIGGQVVGIAVDLSSNLIWFRNGASGNWNGNSANNPATGTGGASISAIAGTLFPWFISVFGGTQTVTANFGASAFSGAVPSGFTAWT